MFTSVKYLQRHFIGLLSATAADEFRHKTISIKVFELVYVRQPVSITCHRKMTKS